MITAAQLAERAETSKRWILAIARDIPGAQMVGNLWVFTDEAKAVAHVESRKGRRGKRGPGRKSSPS